MRKTNWRGLLLAAIVGAVLAACGPEDSSPSSQPPPNAAPTISGAPSTTATAGSTYAFPAQRDGRRRRCVDIQRHRAARVGND